MPLHTPFCYPFPPKARYEGENWGISGIFSEKKRFFIELKIGDML